MLDKKELTLTLDDFRTIFHLPQATDNNHDHFVHAPTFSEMVPFYINDLGFTLELRSTSNFKTIGLLQPWQTLCKIFTKLIVSHYMTSYPEISRRVRDRYHNLADDVMIKSIFNSGKSKGIIGMKIPNWMITDEMKLRENYQLYVEVFRIDVSTTQSQQIESTQGTHKTTSAPRSPNPVVAEGESSAPRKSTVIRLRIPPRLSTRLTPPTLIPTTDEADDLILQDTLQLVEGSENVEENVEVHSSPLRNDDNQNDPGTRLQRRSDRKVWRKFNVLAKNLEDIMMESVPNMVDERIKKILQTQVPLHVAQGLILEREKSQADVTKMIAEAIQQERENLHLEISSQVNDAIANHIPSTTISTLPDYERRPSDDPHDDAHPEGENSAKRQKTSDYGMFDIRGSSSGQDYESEPCPSTLGNQEQSNDFDYWTDSYAIDDDVLPNEKVSQELVDEAKLHKMQNFLKSDIVWESKKEIIVLPYQPKPTLVVQSCQRDPKAPRLPLVNQDLLYLKKGNSGPDKIVLSLHKFPAVIFPDDDIEERMSRWVKKCVKRFNTYARYEVEHWKNPHAKIFHIKNQQAPRKTKEEIYSNSKIVQIIKTYWELGYEHKFITKIVARRENGSIVSITESDYKNLNKNDIEDMYLLIINHKVDYYAETGLLWSLSVFIKSTMIWERVHDF
ncbi:hypothetical protein Tco_0527902 [Tanacetum coccineum]